MERSQTSHKGQNGRVLVVGGNERYHGAPIIAGLAAEKSGADLVTLVVPTAQQHLARSFSLNLIVETFSGGYLRGQDIQKILHLAEQADVLVIGNGLGEKPQTLRALRKLLQQSTCDLVIDAAALVAFADIAPLDGRKVVLTPHAGELKKLQLSDEEASLVTQAQKWHCSIVLKGPEDLIVSPQGEVFRNPTGHPIMTKGGTGDALAGIIGGLMAQGLSGTEAATQACHDWGKVGEYLARQQGLGVTLAELLDAYPSSST